MPMLRFVIALEPEARPLIARYRLAPAGGDAAFKVWREGDVALVVSGVGKVASAAAAAYLHARAGGARHAAWINAGIAGHGVRAVGEAVVAHAIRDRASGTCRYPPLVFAPPAPTGEVVTVDTVEEGYGGDAAYEMEASGFYATACRFATAELVQCLKVVSDGPGAPARRLSAARVEQLVGDRLGEIEGLVEALAPLAAEVRCLEENPPELGELTARWRFTVTETRQLRRLFQRWRALAPGRPLPVGELASLRRGKDVVRRLRDQVDGVDVVTAHPPHPPPELPAVSS